MKFLFILGTNAWMFATGRLLHVMLTFYACMLFETKLECKKKRVTGEEKAVIQEEEEETFERVDGFYLEVEYKGDIYILD